MENYREYWQEELQGVIETFSEDYAEEIGLDRLTDKDIDNLSDLVMADDYLWQTVDLRLREIIEEYCNRNKGWR